MTHPDAETIALSKSAKRRLRDYACGWCGQNLGRKWCGAIYERCDMRQRKAACLDGSKLASVRAEAAALRAIEPPK